MSGVIRHTSASQRRHYRVAVPLHVIISGNVYKSVDWSLSGIRVAGYHAGTHHKGDVVSAEISIPFQGFSVSFPIDITVVEHNDNGELAGEFVNLDKRKNEILKYFFNAFMSGEMVCFEDTIRRLDIPVSKASLQPDNHASEQNPQASQRTRTKVLLAYLVAGVVLTALLLSVLYVQFFQIQVETAMVVSPTEILHAPITGSIAEVYVKEKTSVGPGQPLFRFADPRLEREIELASLTAKEAQDFSERRELIKHLKTNAESGRKSYQRALNLYKKGLITQSALLEKKNKYSEMKQEYIKEAGELKELHQEQEMRVEKYNLLVKQRDNLIVKSPSAGRLLKFLATEGNSVKLGEPVAIFEKDAQKSVQAFLTQKEALAVAVSDRVNVFFPSLDLSEPYIVTDIDYVSRDVGMGSDSYIWNVSNARNVTLTLKPERQYSNNALEEILPGTAVIVVIANKPLMHWLPIFSVTKGQK